MYTLTDNSAFIWQDFGEGAEILRVYADNSHLCIPEKINGKNVLSAGPYCFSEIRRVESYIKKDIPDSGNIVPPDGMCEFCGNYVESVVLPDTVIKIANNAFYNCRNFKTLEAGAALKEAGSDIFMNCTNFSKLCLRHRADVPGGLKQVASRLSSHLDVYFYDNGKIHAMLVFPEYTESYDEIAPAHIFGRNITGEGFRARQCFSDDIPDFRQYDAIFDKASVEESVSVIYKMALGRLMYPFMLEDIPRNKYKDYIKCNQKEIMEILTIERELDALYFICSNQYTDAAGIDSAVSKASQAGWGEGTASLLKWKHEFIEDIRKSRYEF